MKAQTMEAAPQDEFAKLGAGKKIAIFLPDLRGGGAERACVNLAQGLVAKDVKVDLVLAGSGGTYLDLVPKEVNLISFDAKSPIMSFPQLSRYLKSEKPDALLGCLNQPNVAAVIARRLSGYPGRVAIWVHNHLSAEAKSPKNLKLRMMPAFAKRFFPWADAIAAVSSGVADDTSEFLNIPRSRITVMFNPVVTPELLSAAKQDPGHPWFEPGGPPVFVGAGRLTRQKNFPLLIRSFSQMQSNKPARLAILGEGEDRAELQALIDELNLSDRVALLGFQKNPFAFLSRSAAFALSSSWEGLPTILIEAMACDVPVISTDCPSGPMEILENGKYGTLLPMDDEKALASAMDAILSGEKGAAPKEAWERFTVEACADRYIKFLLEPNR